MSYTKKNGEAAVPVIAVILMVATTLIFAVVIAAFASGMAGNIQKTKVLAVTADHRNIGGTQTLFITYKGGPDAGQVSSLTVTFNGASQTMSTVIGTAVSTTTGVLSSNDNHIVVAATFFDGTSQVILDTFV